LTLARRLFQTDSEANAEKAAHGNAPLAAFLLAGVKYDRHAALIIDLLCCLSLEGFDAGLCNVRKSVYLAFLHRVSPAPSGGILDSRWADWRIFKRSEISLPS
jgi:hypothetical protein